ncbi:hypothetical protein BJ878DRAFT_426757 [Calycina marina]|uniref:BZIP domain-containing protein n=1 Tax=Calycina marina TaxID=1763456 RepID=A0A9P7YYG4_9HELO|nr:hypothetical protein BJ878DRAFT_426757 [Calycina marina]
MASGYQQDPSSGGAYGSTGSQSDSARSPSGLLGFFKSDKKPSRGEDNPPKRRGPKPDSKPALTRRQELNRQAQRTHRERKELYIKAMEQEILRLKESFSKTTRDKDSLAEENRQLKLLLAHNGIAWPGTGTEDLQRNPDPDPSNGYTSTASMSGSYAPGSTGYSPSPNHSNFNFNGGPVNVTHGNGRSMNKQQVQPGVDYDQAGIDFVLTLERPCMTHMQFLVERSAEEGGEPCGHALMASCPPDPFPGEDIPFGHSTGHLNGEPKTWDISKSDLAYLLDLSKRLNLGGEITPVMAWGMVLSHKRFSELKTEDFSSICLDLGAKIRCYGFGAVLEEFEVRDALESVFYNKSDVCIQPLS